MSKLISLASLQQAKERFYKSFTINEKTNCWEWVKGLNIGGYGNFSIDHTTYRAHRVSMVYHKSFDLLSKELVLHKCNNRKCVNPEHLYVGDYKQNAHDKIAHGTHQIGERNAFRKLTDEQVLTIRKKYDSGLSLKQIQQEFSLLHGTICNIIRNTCWKHLPLTKRGRITRKQSPERRAFLKAKGFTSATINVTLPKYYSLTDEEFFELYKDRMPCPARSKRYKSRRKNNE